MLKNLKNVIKTEYGTQKAAALAMTLFDDDNPYDTGNLSRLINDNDYTSRLNEPTLNRIKKAFPKYNYRWILHDELPKFNTEKKEDFILNEPESIYTPEKPNTPLYMNTSNDLKDELIKLQRMVIEMQARELSKSDCKQEVKSKENVAS